MPIECSRLKRFSFRGRLRVFMPRLFAFVVVGCYRDGFGCEVQFLVATWAFAIVFLDDVLRRSEELALVEEAAALGASDLLGHRVFD